MIHTVLSHPKFKKLKRRLKASQVVVVGVLESIWMIGKQVHHDGGIGRMSNEDIAAHIEYDGDHDQLISALVDCGWLDLCPENRLVIHDWEQHRPNFVKAIAARREKGQLPTLGSEPRVPNPGFPTQGSQQHNITQHSLSSNSSPLRGDESESALVGNGPGGPSRPDAIDFVPLLTFPCRGKEKEWHLSQEFVGHMETAYPGLPIMPECKEALAWVVSNTERIKTANGMKRFLNAWLSKAANTQARPTHSTTAHTNGKILSPEAQKTRDMFEATKKMILGKHSNDIPIAGPNLALEFFGTVKKPSPITEPPKTVIDEIRAHSDDDPKNELDW